MAENVLISFICIIVFNSLVAKGKPQRFCQFQSKTATTRYHHCALPFIDLAK